MLTIDKINNYTYHVVIKDGSFDTFKKMTSEISDILKEYPYLYEEIDFKLTNDKILLAQIVNYESDDGIHFKDIVTCGEYSNGCQFHIKLIHSNYNSVNADNLDKDKFLWIEIITL